MVTEVATLPAQVPLSDLMSEGLLIGGHQSYPVLRAERVVGVLSMGAVLALSFEERRSTSVQAVMTPLGEAVVARADEPLVEAVARMARRGMGRLLVVDEERLEGMLSLGSVFGHVRRRLSPRNESNQQGGFMSLIMTIIIGGIIGWLASILMKTNAQMGILANVVVGIIGSFLGTAIAGALGLPVQNGLGSWLVAFLGAALLIALLRALGVFSRVPALR